MSWAVTKQQSDRNRYPYFFWLFSSIFLIGLWEVLGFKKMLLSSLSWFSCMKIFYFCCILIIFALMSSNLWCILAYSLAKGCILEIYIKIFLLLILITWHQNSEYFGWPLITLFLNFKLVFCYLFHFFRAFLFDFGQIQFNFWVVNFVFWNVYHFIGGYLISVNYWFLEVEVNLGLN